MRGDIYCDYDDFAWFYNRYWGNNTSSPASLDLLHKLILSRLPTGAKILDLCCGSGQLDHLLTQRGFEITGIDGSAELLAYARRNAPQAEFIHADARSFGLPALYEGAISIYDSLNHIMTLEELGKVFENVHRALAEEGLFLFDLNMEDAYREQWKASTSVVESDHAYIAVFGYDPELKTARGDITMFRRVKETWQRRDVTILQKAYTEEEIISTLSSCGYTEISPYDMTEDLGVEGMAGRTFFLCRKSR